MSSLDWLFITINMITPSWPKQWAVIEVLVLTLRGKKLLNNLSFLWCNPVCSLIGRKPFCFVASFCYTLPFRSHTHNFSFDCVSGFPFFVCLYYLFNASFSHLGIYTIKKKKKKSLPSVSASLWNFLGHGVNIVSHFALSLWLGDASSASSSWFLWEAWLLFMV